MPYCTNADVLAIVHTSLTAVQIDDLILRTDERIKLKIDVGTVNALILEDISATWTAYRVMLVDPNARRLGEYQEDRAVALALLKAEIEELLITGVGGVKVVATREELA